MPFVGILLYIPLFIGLWYVGLLAYGYGWALGLHVLTPIVGEERASKYGDVTAWAGVAGVVFGGFWLVGLLSETF